MRRPLPGCHPLVRLVSAGLVCAGLASCSSPAAPGPSSVTLQIGYTQPSPETLPPPGLDSATCAHHYAPANLSLETSWGETRRLEQTGTLTYALTSPGAAAAQDHWLTFVDIALCPTGNVRVTQGVTVNGTALTRTIDRNGIPSLAFRVDSSGRVLP